MRRLVVSLTLLAALGCGSDKPKALADSDVTAEDERVPAGTPRYGEGEVLPHGLTWMGFPEGSSTPGTVSLDDYYDPDGSKGIRAIFVDTVSPLCAACLDERSQLSADYHGKWASLGIKVIDLVIDDTSGTRATLSSASDWKMSSGAPWAVAADPSFSFSHPGSNGLPVHLAIDARTLTVVTRLEGKDPSFAGVESLAAKNAP